MAEPILLEENNRHPFFPIQHQDLYALYKKQLDCFWTTDEIEMSKDKDAFLNSESYYRRCLSLPIHPGMQKTDVERIVDTLNTVLMKHASAFS